MSERSWSAAYGPDVPPAAEQIAAFIGTPLYGQLQQHIAETYGAAPSVEYSSCSAQPGWNVKYKKSGRALCTLYPMDGYFIAMVSVGGREQAEAELLLPTMTTYLQQLYARSAASAMGRWLMIEVRDARVLADAIALMQLRVKKPQKKGR